MTDLWALRTIAQIKALNTEMPDVEVRWHSPQHIEFETRTFAGSDQHEYTLRLCANPMHAEVWPDLYVWKPINLPRKPSGTINEIGWSGTWHTAAPGPEGRVHICHTHVGQWDANCTYVQVMVRGVLWCTAYEVHLMSGEPVGSILDRLAEQIRQQQEKHQ